MFVIPFGTIVKFEPGFPMDGYITAMVIDVDGDDLILELNCNPEPEEYGENTMLWPKSDQDRLWIVKEPS